jgi:K+-sensing histidine kinase KdpD
VRRAADLAGAIHAALIAVVVETPESERRPFDQTRDLQETLDDAVDLGADIIRVEAPDEVGGIEQVARNRRATHVVLPFRPTSGLQRLTTRALGDQLLARLPALEIHTVGPSGHGAGS